MKQEKKKVFISWTDPRHAPRASTGEMLYLKFQKTTYHF